MRFLAVDVVTPPTDLPVTVAEFVNHARLNGITVNREPEMLERQLSAATERAEGYLRRSLLTQTLQALFVPVVNGAYASALLMILPRGPVQGIEEITSGGATVDPAGYRLEWNTVILTSPLVEPATVKYKAGYGDAGAAVPNAIREGILEYATVLYDDRMGMRAAKYEAAAGRTIPAGVVDLWRPFQIEVSG